MALDPNIKLIRSDNSASLLHLPFSVHSVFQLQVLYSSICLSLHGCMVSGTVGLEQLGIKVQMRNVFNLFNLRVTSLCWMMVGKYELQINTLLLIHADFYSYLVYCGSSSLKQKSFIAIWKSQWPEKGNLPIAVFLCCAVSPKALQRSFLLFGRAFHVFVCELLLKERCILTLRLWSWHTFSLENVRAIWIKATSKLPC